MKSISFYRDQPLLEDLIRICNENLSNESFSVVQLCDEMNLSRTSLFRKTASASGCTPIELLRRMRMRKAARLLERGDMNVTQVMYEVGMQHPSHFARTFKRHIGVNPAEYRRRNSKSNKENRNRQHAHTWLVQVV